METKKHRVCMIGSGCFACAIVRNIGANVAAKPNLFEPQVRMWVFEETIQGRKLTDIINQDHENVKYLPGKILPENVVAIPDLGEAVAGADLVVFCLPHQFIQRTCAQIKGKLAEDVKAISLVKGFHTDEATGQFRLLSEVIGENLDLKSDVAVMMGANLADEIAEGKFCETTVASKDLSTAKLFSEILETEDFRVNAVSDSKSVEMCGALKNIVAVGAGFVDGMELGSNTKSALIRLGLVEMIRFIRKIDPDAGKTEVFFESAGIADLITTCTGGRNRKVAEAFVRSSPRKTLKELEAELLNGQKLQGPMTASEVYEKIKAENWEREFPLFVAVHKICASESEPESLIPTIKAQPKDYGSLL